VDNAQHITSNFLSLSQVQIGNFVAPGVFLKPNKKASARQRNQSRYFPVAADRPQR